MANSAKLYRAPGTDPARPFFIDLPVIGEVLAVYDDHVKRVPAVPLGAEEALWDAELGGKLANCQAAAPMLVTDAAALALLLALQTEKAEDFDGPES